MHLPSHHHLQTPYQKIIREDFPSGTVVKAPHYQCGVGGGRAGSILDQECKIPLAVWDGQNFFKKHIFFYFLMGEETQNLIKNQGHCYNEPNIWVRIQWVSQLEWLSLYFKTYVSLFCVFCGFTCMCFNSFLKLFLLLLYRYVLFLQCIQWLIDRSHVHTCIHRCEREKPLKTF